MHHQLIVRRLLRLMCIGSIGTVIALSHETLTHQKIGNVAVTYLQGLGPTRPSLPNIGTSLLGGAVREDDGPFSSSNGRTLRSIFHFTPALGVVLPSCNSVDWGLGDGPCSAGAVFVFGVTNEHRWSQSLLPDISTWLT